MKVECMCVIIVGIDLNLSLRKTRVTPLQLPGAPGLSLAQCRESQRRLPPRAGEQSRERRLNGITILGSELNLWG